MGCAKCWNSGHYAVAECPQTYVTGDVWDAIEAAEFARKGVLPMSGGLLEQTAAFATACRIVWAEEDANRSETTDPLLWQLRNLMSS